MAKNVNRLVSMLVIICFMLSFVFAGSSYGDFMSQPEGLGWMVMLGMLMSVFTVLYFTDNLSPGIKYWGWIEADKTLKEDNYLVFPPALRSRARIKNDCYIYSTPSKQSLVGLLYAGDKYVIEKEESNQDGKWYQVIFRYDRVFITSEVK
jgi:hypothetical protein